MSMYRTYFKSGFLVWFMLVSLLWADCAWSAEHVRQSIETDAESVAPGQIFTVRITLEIDEGWHLYGALENQEFGIPTTVVPVVHPWILFGGIGYPAAEKITDELLGEMWEYKKQVVIPVDCRLSENFKGSEITPRFIMTFQACSDTVCLPIVKDKPLSISLSVDVNRGKKKQDRPAVSPWMTVSQDTARPRDSIRVYTELVLLEGIRIAGGEEQDPAVETSFRYSVEGGAEQGGTVDKPELPKGEIVESFHVVSGMTVSEGVSGEFLMLKLILDYTPMDSEKKWDRVTGQVLSIALPMADTEDKIHPIHKDLFSAVFESGDDAGMSGKGASPEPIRKHLLVSRERVVAGETVWFALDVHLGEGYHIYDAVKEQFAVKTRIKPTRAKQLRFGEVVYPESTAHINTFTKEELWIYQGDVRFYIPVTVDEGAKEGTVRVALEFECGVCRDEMCLPPTRDLLSMELEIVPKSAAGRDLHLERFRGLEVPAGDK